jgi:hypothetical protein
MGYVAPSGGLDVSNSNTPEVADPTNPVGISAFRAVAQVNAHGKFHFTETNAYSGNNGRAAILNSADNVIYTAGNAGNGGNPQPAGVIEGTGAQILTPQNAAESGQHPSGLSPVGSFNITQLGDAPDKIGKDTNFRGLTIFDNVVYLTKGSGSNGVNTVYFIDTTRSGLPERRRTPGAGCTPADEPDDVRPVHGADPGPAEQHVHPQRLPDRVEVEDVLPVRSVVRQRSHGLCR